MSMPALLSHFGIHKARYVTDTGRVIFDGVTSTNAGGFTHPTYGSVTQVENHTFHGGVEDLDDFDDPPAKAMWWDNPERIRAHVDAMATAFPGFDYIQPENDLGPCWVGIIDTGRGQFRICVALRGDENLPRIAVLNRRLGVNAGRRWQRSPHLYDTENLCVADRDDWNPAEHTAATATAWAAHWLAAYTEWWFTGRWPVEGVNVVAS